MEKLDYAFDNYTKKKIIGFYKENGKNIPIINHVNVLVVGGSQSGVTAAIAAARNGARVEIVERFGFLGGQSVYGMVVQWEKRAFINNLGAVLTKGLPKEILDRIIEKGGSDGLWNEPPGCPEMRDGEEWINPEAIKITFFEMCEEEGVEILLHTLATGVILEDAEKDTPKLKGVIFENKTGRFAITADIIIDATADLDLIWKAIGEKGCRIREPSKRIDAGFYVWYGGIDSDKFINWYVSLENIKGGYPDHEKFKDKILRHLKEEKLIIVPSKAFDKILYEAEEEGLMEKIEEISEKAQIYGIISFGMKWVGNDRWCLHFTGIPNLNLLDSWELTKYEIFRQKLAFYMLPILRKIPGWEKSYISRENLYMGSRETRVLIALKTLKTEDIYNPANASAPTPENAIGRSGAHDPGKNRLWAGYPVPYEITIPKYLKGTLVCARAVGTDFGTPLNAHRGITPNMVVAQGVGTAAALCIKNNVEPRDLDLKLLQETLRKQGVQLDHETMKFDFEIPKEKIRKPKL